MNHRIPPLGRGDLPSDDKMAFNDSLSGSVASGDSRSGKSDPMLRMLLSQAGTGEILPPSLR